MELEVRQLCSSTLQSPGDSPRMANVLWPWLLLHLKPAAHGSALPLLLRTSVGVVRMIPEGGRLPLASRCGKGNRGCWSSPRATLPQDLLAQLLVSNPQLGGFLILSGKGLLLELACNAWLFSPQPPEELARHIPHVHCISTQHLSAFNKPSELSEPATFLAPLILGLDQVPQHKLVQPSDDSNSCLYKCWFTGLMLSLAETVKPQLWLMVEMVNFREEEEREEILRGKDRAWLQSPDQQHALLAISYLGKFQPHLSKEQEAETINTCIAGTMVQRPALAKLRGTEVAESSAMRVECLQQLPWKALDLMLQPFLELHLTPTMLLRLFLHLQPWICSPRAQERSRAVRASARFLMFYRFQAITEDLRPMAEQGYKARLLTSQAFDAQEATRHWASQALYWIFTPCKDHKRPVGAGQGPGASGHVEGLEDDLFASYFLTITGSPARHLSGAQQDLPSDASPHRAMVIHPKQALKSIPRLLLPNLQASQEGERMACTALFAEFLGSPLLMENEPKAMQKQARTFFEDENSGLRQTSMELFGHLSKFVSKKSSLFRAEVEKSMGMLLIHLQEPPGDPVELGNLQQRLTLQIQDNIIIMFSLTTSRRLACNQVSILSSSKT
ncbi:unnamed protein product [Caretta caretta]